MDQTLLTTPQSAQSLEPLDAASQPFVGRWNHLVSTTNWEKGQIILQWREALVAGGAAAIEYSDEAWSRRVGGLTAQHAGRLRRVAQRFGAAYRDYEGLYWSHFQAALDWDDAEMWLEGAVRSGWSVAKMRNTRWETLGSLPDQKPLEGDVVAAETDEDFEPALNEAPTGSATAGEYTDVQAGPLPEGPDFGDEEAPQSDAEGAVGASIYADGEEEAIEFVRPFASLGDLPGDLADAFDAFKLAILHHKTDGWAQISCDDVLASLEALKKLALAPA